MQSSNNDVIPGRFPDLTGKRNPESAFEVK